MAGNGLCNDNYVFIYTASYQVRIITTPPGNNGSNNTLEYLAGSNISLTCVVTPTPPVNSEINWSCSTGCFADMQTAQTISATDLNSSDSGLITCSVTISNVEYHSEPLDLQVSG